MQDLYLTGTSYATPIAAAIAATVLGFAQPKAEFDQHHWRLLCSYGGMRKVFKLLSAKGDHHRYVTLEQLEDKGHTTSHEIVEAIKAAIMS